MTSQQWFSVLGQVPAVGGAVALFVLALGLLRRRLYVTIVALWGFIGVGLVAVPVFLRGDRRETAVAAVVGLEAAAVVALVSLFCWYTTRRYPLFPASAALILGLLAGVLVLRAM